MAKSKSRPARWAEAAAAAREALDLVSEVVEDTRIAIEDLIELKKSEIEDGVQELMQEMQDEIDADAINAALSDLKDVKEEYQEWLDNMPEGLRSSPLGEKLEEVCNLDLEIELDVNTNCEVSVDWGIESNLDGVESIIDNAEGTDLPRGFGKD